MGFSTRAYHWGPPQNSLAIMGILATVQCLAAYKHILHLKWPP